MAATTLADARIIVADHLDDPNNRRWTTTQIDRALQPAVSTCVSEYADAGGKQFDVETSATTSASTGAVALTSSDPLLIRNVQVLSGERYSPVMPARRIDRTAADKVARTLRCDVVRNYTIPTTASHALVGNGATPAPTWPAFDNWVCAEAALLCGIKDNDMRPGLEAMAGRFRSAVLARANSGKSRPLPLPRDELAWAYDLGWTWDPTAQTIYLVRIPQLGGLW